MYLLICLSKESNLPLNCQIWPKWFAQCNFRSLEGMEVNFFSNISCMFLKPIIFSNLNSNCSNLLDLRNLQEQVKKAFCYQKLFWPFTVWTNCSSDLKIFANSRHSTSNFKIFSWWLEQFFLTVGQNNFGNKIPFSLLKYLIFMHIFLFLIKDRKMGPGIQNENSNITNVGH